MHKHADIVSLAKSEFFTQCHATYLNTKDSMSYNSRASILRIQAMADHAHYRRDILVNKMNTDVYSTTMQQLRKCIV